MSRLCIMQKIKYIYRNFYLIIKEIFLQNKYLIVLKFLEQLALY